ncbi:hypothetical protein [Bacillus mycoides]|uniref:hypothetical protein n=1 Tax=Bacillus mycoides TaxID=1405 RepID=UPI00273BBC34|nr:hypothetical protein [Bacillus mycoides]
MIAKRNEKPLPFKLVIVDYANDDLKLEYISRVNKAVKIPKKHAFQIDSENILFGGAHSIKDIIVKV